MGMVSGPPRQEQRRVCGARVHTCVHRCVLTCEPVSLGGLKMWRVRIWSGIRGQKGGPCQTRWNSNIRKHHEQMSRVS